MSNQLVRSRDGKHLEDQYKVPNISAELRPEAPGMITAERAAHLSLLPFLETVDALIISKAAGKTPRRCVDVYPQHFATPPTPFIWVMLTEWYEARDFDVELRCFNDDLYYVDDSEEELGDFIYDEHTEEGDKFSHMRITW